mmetsp:Transcript_21482/g.44694  ORF Transcript_21482/g.44694 Transcript_21482/m.44694 type:complete len:94 (+) Transcript_21482:255-536(+)
MLMLIDSNWNNLIIYDQQMNSSLSILESRSTLLVEFIQTTTFLPIKLWAYTTTGLLGSSKNNGSCASKYAAVSKFPSILSGSLSFPFHVQKWA